MITMFDESAERSRSHGLRLAVLDAQADRLGLPRLTGRCADLQVHLAAGLKACTPSDADR